MRAFDVAHVVATTLVSFVPLLLFLGTRDVGLALAILVAPITLIGPTVAVIAHVIARRSQQVSG